MTQLLRTTTRITEGGRIVIPAEIRKLCKLEVGTEVVLTVENNHVTLMSEDAAIDEARALVRKYIPKGAKLSEELMAERRQEAARE